MTKRFHDKLTDVLRIDHRFVDNEGELITAKVTSYAWQIDHALVRLLLADADFKAKFFDEIDGHWILPNVRLLKGRSIGLLPPM